MGGSGLRDRCAAGGRYGESAQRARGPAPMRPFGRCRNHLDCPIPLRRPPPGETLQQLYGCTASIQRRLSVLRGALAGAQSRPTARTDSCCRRRSGRSGALLCDRRSVRPVMCMAVAGCGASASAKLGEGAWRRGGRGSSGAAPVRARAARPGLQKSLLVDLLAGHGWLPA